MKFAEMGMYDTCTCLIHYKLREETERQLIIMNLGFLDMSAVFKLDNGVQMNHQCQRVQVQRKQESKQNGIRRGGRLQEGGVGEDPGEHLHSLGQPPASLG